MARVASTIAQLIQAIFAIRTSTVQTGQMSSVACRTCARLRVAVHSAALDTQGYCAAVHSSRRQDGIWCSWL